MQRMSRAKLRRRAEQEEENAIRGTENYSSVKKHELDIHDLLRYISDEANSLLSIHKVFGEDVTERWADARRSIVPNPEDRLKIAIAGASGVGKSALLNALCAQKDISRSDSCIEGCTSATCELTGSLQGQKHKFHVQVFFYSPEEVSTMLNKYIEDYNLLHFNAEDSADRTPAETHRLKGAASTLIEVLRSINADDAAFSTSDKVAKMMQHHHAGGTIEHFKRDALGQSTSILAREYPNKIDDMAEKDFDSAQDLNSFTHPLGSTSTVKGKSSLWPLVKRIRIYIKDCLILRDIIIGDAPGVSDINQLRKANAYQYIDDCDHLILVASMQGRLGSDECTDILLERYKEPFRGQLTLVFTRCDDPVIGVSTIDKLLSEGQHPESAAERANYIALGHQLSDEEIKLEGHEEEGREAEAAQSEKTIATIKRSMYEVLVVLRNQYTIWQFRELKNIRNDNIPIFCVSSLHYWSCADSKSAMGLTLGLQYTGIPSLRESLLGLTDSHNQHHLAQQIQKFRSSVKAIEIVVQRTALKNREMIEKSILGFNLDAAPVRKSIVDSFECTKQTLRLGRRGILTKGERFRKGVAAMHHGTLRATVARDGKFTSRSKQRVFDFNPDVNNCFAPTVQQILDTRKSRRINDLETIRVNRREVFQALIESLIAMQFDLGIDARLIRQVTAIHLKIDDEAFDKYEKRMRKLERGIYLNVTQPEGVSYSKQGMAAFYNYAKTISGNGLKQRICNSLHEHMDPNHGNIFDKITDAILEYLRREDMEALNRFEKATDTNMRDLLDKLMSTIPRGQRFTKARLAAQEFLIGANKCLDDIERVLNGPSAATAQLIPADGGINCYMRDMQLDPMDCSP